MSSLDNGEPSFTNAPETVAFAGFLFDMDGTIIDSKDAIVRHWHEVGKELGVDPAVILETSHGRRSIDTIKEYDTTKATWDYVHHIEGLLPKKFGSDAVEIPGARQLLDAMVESEAPWAIVTSGTRPLIQGWLDLMRLAQPKNMVTAEDVQSGKPDPECYLLGKKQIRAPESSRILVFEDAPAGIRAGKAAGCDVLAVATTHSIARIKDAGADWIVKDLRSVKIVPRERSSSSPLLHVEISNGLRQ